MQDLFKRGFGAISLLFILGVTSHAQTPTPTPAATPTPEAPISAAKIASGDLTAEQVAELAIAVYGFPNGRVTLLQIRKTGDERGRLTITGADGKTQSATYQRWYIRPETGAEKIRLDQQFPNDRFSLISANNEVFGVYNDSAFVPREDATTAFQNQIFHSLDALLRYKETNRPSSCQGAKRMGVDYQVIDSDRQTGSENKVFTLVQNILSNDARIRIGRVSIDANFTTIATRREHFFRTAPSDLSDRTLRRGRGRHVTYAKRSIEGLFTKP